jgi:hypothetical protein
MDINIGEDQHKDTIQCPPDKKYYVYILESSDHAATYVGATVDLDHRLRQHNKELVGGAHATSVKVAKVLFGDFPTGRPLSNSNGA